MIIKTFQTIEDYSDLELISKKAFGTTSDSNISEWFSFNEMRKAIDQERGICLKALSDDNKLLGFIYAQQENPINGNEGLEKWVIVIIAVDPTFSRKGIGSSLMKEIEKQAINYNAQKMFVYTNKGDNDVINFYKKNGYSDAGWIKDYQYGENNSAVFLLKKLT